MKKYIILLALCLCLPVFATGPSHTTLKITPLSINEQGSLLYRYKIITNFTGGHYLEDVLYGIGSFKNGKFTSLQQQIIHGNNTNSAYMDYETYNTDLNKLDQWLKAPCKPSELMNGFTSCNLENYAVNQLMDVAELKQKYAIDVTKNTAYFLLPGKLQADNKAHIHVNYALKDLIIADFKNCTEEIEEETHSFVFIAQHPVDKFNNFDKNDYGYECIDVTGIIIQEQ